MQPNARIFLSIKDNLWIEGYGVSSNSGDTGLQLTYRPIKPLSGDTLQDIIDTMKMTVVKVELKEVSFNYSGGEAIQLADHKEDKFILSPEWIASTKNKISPPKKNEPAFYSKVDKNGKELKFHVKAKIEIIPDNLKAKFWAFGGFGGLNSEEKAVELDENKECILQINETPKSISINDVEWNWMVEVEDRIKFNFAKTNHRIYISKKPPVMTFPYFYKNIVEWSCDWNKGYGERSDNEILFNSLIKFYNLGKKDYKYVFPLPDRKNFLSYIGSANSIDNFLDKKRGACGELADVLKNIVEIQGIFNVNIIDIVPDEDTFDNLPELIYLDKLCYYIVSPAMGGNRGPWIFGDHAFLELNGRVYDPTYGKEASSWQAYEDIIVNKFSISYYYDGDDFNDFNGNGIWDNGEEYTDKNHDGKYTPPGYIPYKLLDNPGFGEEPDKLNSKLWN